MLQKQLSSYFSCDKYTFSRKSHNTDVRRNVKIVKMFIVIFFIFSPKFFMLTHVNVGRRDSYECEPCVGSKQSSDVIVESPTPGREGKTEESFEEKEEGKCTNIR